MPPNLRIGFIHNSPNQAYYPGSSISGTLMLDVDKPESYNQILVEFLGRSCVSYVGTRQGYGGTARDVRLTSTEPYVELTALLWSNRQSLEGKLPPGQYIWPFTFYIPLSVPSSYEGIYGNIRYSFMGKIIAGRQKVKDSVEVTIPVQQLVGIADPHLLQPVRQEIQKTVCCLCCASGPIVLTVAIPKTGVIVGDLFPLGASLENGSNRRLSLVASITQQTTFYAQGDARSPRRIIFTVGSDIIEAQATRNWEPTIEIPTAGIDIIHGASCRNIKITYTLDVTCIIPQETNLGITIPLQFGNYHGEQRRSRRRQCGPHISWLTAVGSSNF